MENAILFINYAQQDHNFAEQLKTELQKAGIQILLPEYKGELADVKTTIQQIESIAENGGVMLLLLSAKAVKDPLFISNTQYFCELTGKKQSLLFCKIEDLPKENAITLYYPRGVMINISSQLQNGMKKVVINAKRLLGMETQGMMIPKRMKKRTVTRLITMVAVLAVIGGIGSFFSDQYTERQSLIKAAEAAAQAPIVINEPFQNESINQGLIVDQRYLPVYSSEINPVSVAPFQFKPAYVHQSLLFNDPQFENTVDNSIIGIENVSIREEDLRVISQQNGVLHIGAATSDLVNQRIGIPINHYFSLNDVSYIGFRFRLDDYLGWTNINQPIEGYLGTRYFPMGIINFSTQTLMLDDSSVFIGTDWHVLEALISAKDNSIEIYLDGDLFSQRNDLPALYAINNLEVSLNLQNTTDWINLYIDEIVIGGNSPLKYYLESEERTYHFSLSDPQYIFTFDDYSISPYIVENSQLVSISDGELGISFNQGDYFNQTVFEIPTKTITEINYYALKYRVIETPGKYWNYNSNLVMKLENQEHKQQNNDYELYVQTSLHSENLGTQSGLQKYSETKGSSENFQLGGWHTLEMLIIPSSVDESMYRIQFWHDNLLVVEQDIENSDLYTDPGATLKMRYVISSGDLSFGRLKIEVDDITSGFLPESEIRK